ncbi:enoyl-CoA hydratase [Rhodococcus sp. 06-462-5]|uniref:enoyl-CoA hydratase/isomerase family protein n=1 Tax=unclassified Rhodococcus (in: high G+C Gram-positive bacteria) TaxID=192944 RepID=UPI000B9BC7ED|nr:MULTISPECIES: enoyl-CoA hydratase-related protein [unclassified Rhodococcus (in: high G+C Gram-positive bacteria)]OZC77236.1 enoyl-CoA hydratase [Rhodococcus sp. 06-462-5]OZE63393.1 enoyl-CoA hydratase [Rhodococcus sp. 02-925g]
MYKNDSSEQVVTIERDGHVLVVTIDRPKAANSIDARVHTQLGEAWDAAESDREIRAIVLTGAGSATFCGGADLKALGAGGPDAVTPPETAHWGFAGIVRHPISVPIIAAVNGSALGGGTELALASDMVVASTTASFGLPEVHRGLIAGAGGTFRLMSAIPEHIALELLLTGKPMTAQTAANWGLVNRVVEPNDVMSTAMELAHLCAAGAPLAVRASKRLARRIVANTQAYEEDSWLQNQQELDRLTTTHDVVEGITAFLQKRNPEWTAQ